MASSSSFSSIIASIDASLDHLATLWLGDFRRMRIGLKNLKVFLLCLTKFCSHAPPLRSSRLGSLLLRIEDVIGRIPKEAYTPDDGGEFDRREHERSIININAPEIRSLQEELNVGYTCILNLLGGKSSSFLSVSDVVEITDSILNVKEELFYLFGESMRQLDVLGVQITFLKNFLLFAMRTSVEPRCTQLQNLLIHFEAVAVDVARLFINIYLGHGEYDEILPEEMLLECSILAKKIVPIDPRFCKPYDQALSCSKLYSRRLLAPTEDIVLDDDTMIILKNFLDSLIPLLWDVLQQDACHLVCLKDQLQVLYGGLRFSRSVLKRRPENFDAKIRGQIGFLVCDTGMLIIYLFHQSSLVCAEIYHRLPDLLQRINDIRGEVEKKVSQTSVFNFPRTNELGFVDSIVEDGKELTICNAKPTSPVHPVSKAIRASRHQPPQSSPSMTNEVVGFHDDVVSIIDRLTRGSKELRVVVISGMAGSGKTTLASKVYNDPSVVQHFRARAWWPISQVLDRKKVLLELLNQIDHGMCSKMTEEQDLAEKLWRSLKGKRYLIFLDDVWTTEVWNSLEGSFPDDNTHSRIILTSRNRNIAPHSRLVHEEPHQLSPLSDDESLHLLQMKLYSGKGWPPTLKKLGMQIVERCKGLPLTIVIVAGLLATMEQEGWEKIVDALGSGVGVVSRSDQCKNTLELSYKHLPDYLKPCLLYFGVFPEDQEVSVGELIRLWIAEGFVEKTESKRIEDVAEEYVAGLIDRSLVLVAKQKSTGTCAKSCRIHDLLRDFCLIKAEQENFFRLLQGHDQLSDFEEPRRLQRLCIHSEPEHFIESKIFCPRARSLLFFSTERTDFSYWFSISFIIRIFKLLKVLRIDEIVLDEGLPTEIGALVQLRYLSIRGYRIVIPSSIGRLSNLETFSISSHPEEGPELLQFPNTFWNLRKLKYLDISDGLAVDAILPVENLESSILCELETLSDVFIYSDESMEKQMMMFPNIRRLKCTLLDGLDRIVVPNFLSRLESLSLKGSRWCDPIREFRLPESLRKVTLSGLGLSRTEISIIGKLPNLEVLKLVGTPISNDTLEMDEGEFSKLIFLKLFGLDIVKWTAFDDQLPNLQKLGLEYCGEIEEIPSCLESVPTLEVIDVTWCSRAIESSLERIKEVQVEFGNPNININIQSWKECDTDESDTDECDTDD